MSNKVSRLLKTLGPGILFASTCIGVSHLVQSTRAGANYGFVLLWAIILANLFKYPFFEYGSRYANAAGESIIDGYKKMGKWVLVIYFLITLGSMFFVTAAVGAVTAGFMDNLFGISQLVEIPLFTAFVLFASCTLMLILGKYNLLDSLIKMIGAVLLVSTVLAFVLTLLHGQNPAVADFKAPEVWDSAGIGFLIALMGWMPTAVDLSAWNSLWTIERIKQTGYHPTMKETLFDFNFGYLVSAGLSICFLTMGAFLVYGSGETMPGSSALFANKVVELYTTTIGSWSYLIIATAGFSVMFGTCIAVFDGYARAMERSVELLFFSEEKATEMLNDRKVYIATLLLLALGSFFIIAKFGGKLKVLVDLATAISFMIAPFVAWANFKLVSKDYIAEEHTPPAWLKLLSYGGLVFLIGFGILFVFVKLGLV